MSPGSTAPGGPATTPVATRPLEPTVPVPTFVDENGFDDHTVPRVASVAELMALARPGPGGQASMKFTITDLHMPLDAPDLARVHLLDGNFYGLHDEWYMFRLLNGQPVPGSDAAPIEGQSFATFDAIYQWAVATGEDNLPLGLTFVRERLYASAFYDLALHGDPRLYGVGSIVRFPDPVAGQPDHWLLELEYADAVTPEMVARLFERLARVVPAEVSDDLEWVIRSPQQDEVARRMVAEQLAFHDRIVRYDELVPAGTVTVYSEGVAAGRLLYVGEGGAELGDATAGDIVVTERVPSWLPPASALITSDPQTPLAHVNLLARNRAIPNASSAGIHDDAGLRQAARVRAHAIVMARGTTLQIALISREQYEAWAKGQQVATVAVPQPEIDAVPLVVDLADLVDELSVGGLTESEVADWRPILGGKSAGFITLLSTPGVTPPPDPMAITVRPYLEHIAPIRDLLAEMIDHPDVVGSQRARWIVLEGDDDYAAVFSSEDDATFATTFVESHPPGTPLGDVIAAGGVRAMIEDRPIDPATLVGVTATLITTYREYDPGAGLRFRSSSSVEDIEGFNGAGLYTSYTGYLRPELLADPDDHDNTIERAILRAWASYWSFEAFEERRLAHIDHLSGAMGLTVHARFDDELELDNGVATFTFLPGGGSEDAVLEVNVQAGSVEVTNPDPENVELPERILVTRRNGDLTIERIADSSLAATGEQVMEDAAIEELFEQTAAVADVWRSRQNAGLPVAQRLQTVVLDFEFKTMAEGWPKLRDGLSPLPERLVLRQVRSLDPGLRRLPIAVRDLAAPRDVLMRAALIESVTCRGSDGIAIEHIEITTDPLIAPDMGYADDPLTVGDPPTAGATCSRVTVFASPREALVALVANGDAFVIIGG